MTFTAVGGTAIAESLVADPFTSLAVHYGMLLGVPDFQVLMGNPRGKLRLHQAWQHGPGVVWGYGVSVRAGTAELVVQPGLAVDGLGREVSLAVEHCVDVAKWLGENAQAAKPVVAGDVSTFNAQLVLRHRACLARPVPAMSPPCDGNDTDTAFSRILELGLLELRPYGNDAQGNPEPPEDDRGAAFAALRRLVRGDAAAPGEPDTSSGSALDAFRELAASETSTTRPPAYTDVTPSPSSSRLFPVDEPGTIVLANLPGLRVIKDGDTHRLEAPVIDLSVRRSHLPTWVLSDLLAELLGERGAAVRDAGGPRVTAITYVNDVVNVDFSHDVVEETAKQAVSVQRLDTSAATVQWEPVDVTPVDYTTASPPPAEAPARLKFTLTAPAATETYRIVISGTGATPLVAVMNGRAVPLAGRAGDGPAGDAGRDVVETISGA